MRPRDLAGSAKELARRSPRITCKVLGEAEMERLRHGRSLLGVAQGSAEPPLPRST